MEQPTAIATPAAPAATTEATAAPTTVSAERAASEAGDFSAFAAADLAKRTGTPLPDVAVEPNDDTPAAAPGPDGRPISRRQAKINDAIRESVERATADSRAEIARLTAENARLRTPAAPAPTPAAPTPAATPTVADYKRYAAMPEAPRLSDVDAAGVPVFDSVEEHSAAMAAFVMEQRMAEQGAAAQRQREDASLAEAGRVRETRLREQLSAAQTADPAFGSKLSSEVRDLVPASSLRFDAQGQTVTAAGHVVAGVGPLNVLWDHVYNSAHVPQLLLHFSAHPEDLRRFETRPAHLDALPLPTLIREWDRHIAIEFGKLEASFAAAAPASAPVVPAKPSTISSAPAPAPVHTKTGSSGDAKAAALERGDFATFDRLDQAERAARLAR